MTTEAKLRAIKKYTKEKSKQMNLKFYPSDMDVWDYLQKQPNKAGYIKRLIRNDMEGKKDDQA